MQRPYAAHPPALQSSRVRGVFGRKLLLTLEDEGTCVVKVLPYAAGIVTMPEHEHSVGYDVLPDG